MKTKNILNHLCLYMELLPNVNDDIFSSFGKVEHFVDTNFDLKVRKQLKITNFF